MRRQLQSLSKETTIANSINTLIKYKINGLLTTEENGIPTGVLSKTDIMGAYYADLPIDSPVEYIMSSPPLFCSPDDPLEKALEQMRENSVYRLYVKDSAEDEVIGSLAYPDIVGILYQYCYECKYSHFRTKNNSNEALGKHFKVRDIMTRDVKSIGKNESLIQVMEELSIYRMGAIMVQNEAGEPVGVISKTDLILAYKHGVDPQQPAESIMSTPVRSCKTDDLLEDAIRSMIYSDIHRLFVEDVNSTALAGVFSLTDAARNRSGSCQACISSRITLKP